MTPVILIAGNRLFKTRLLLICVILATYSKQSPTVEASHFRHQRINGSVHQTHLANQDDFQISIGEMCQSDSECANSSICISKVFEEDDYDMEVRLCQCNHRHMKRVDHSCFVKAGHQCYFPNKDSHGRTLYSCMAGLLCKSGINPSDLHGGYCMCPDLHLYTDDPHRWLNVEYEAHRCSTVALRSDLSYLILISSLLTIFSGFISVS